MKNYTINLHQTARTLFLRFCKPHFILLFITLVSGMDLQAQYNPFTNITDDNIAHYNPAIFENYVVYEEWINGEGKDVWLYNITTGEKLKLNSGSDGMALQPDIYGDRVVWQDNRSGVYKIYTYLISRPDIGDYQLLDIDGEQTDPAIYENTLVWIDHRGDEFSANVFMYDISTALITQITTDDDYQQSSPDIWGNIIVYEDGRNGNRDIYMYNIYTKEETQLTEDNAYQTNPCIYKTRVIWEDERNGNLDLYMHNMSYAGTVFEEVDFPIYTGEGFRKISTSNDKNPSIYGDYIVFQSYRNGSWNIYLYSFINYTFGSTTPLITEEKGQINPAIYGDRIVWADERDWEEGTGYEADIWLWTRPPGADLGVSFVEYPDSIITESVFTYTIIVKNFGNQEATDVTFNLTLPDEVEFVHANDSRNNTFSMIDSILNCEIGSLLVGETDSISVIVKSLFDGTITTNCEVSAIENDPIEGNNSNTAVTIAKWVFPQRIGAGEEPSITSDKQGYAHIIYIDYKTLYYGKLVYATNKSGKWVIDYDFAESKDIYNKAIAQDSKGNIHIVYDIRGDLNNPLMYRNNVSGEWSDPILIMEHGGAYGSLTLRIDSNDKMHIGFMEYSSRWGSLSYINNKSGAWEEKIISEETYYRFAFDIDNDGYAHFIYIKEDDEDWNFKPTYVTNKPDGIWTEPEYFDDDYVGGSTENFWFDMAVDNNNYPHVIYEGGKNVPGEEREVLNYAVRTNEGWQREIIDDKEEYSNASVAIAMDLNNQPHLLYANQLDWPESELVYLKHTNGNSKKQIIEQGDHSIFEVDMCADTFGIIHATCQEYIGDQYFVNYYKINNNPTFPKISVTQNYLSFGNTLLDSVSASQNVNIINIGNKLLTIFDVYISGSDAMHFSITQNPCNSLNPSGICSISVQFNPQSPGYKYAKLRIISNDPDQPDTKIPLEGIAQEPTLVEALINNNLKTYPNPVKDILKIEFDESCIKSSMTLKISSILGKIEKAINLNAAIAPQLYSINVSDLPAGVYILTIEGKNLLYHFKFIKNN